MTQSRDRSGIGLITCVALVTSTMVGTGVYTSLGFQLQSLESGFAILALWALGGLLSLCGALSYAELAARIPRSGGEYTYLTEIYHPAVGFMAGCVSLIAGFAAPTALAAIAFGTYLQAALPGCPAPIASVAVVTMLSMAHLRSLHASSVLQDVTTSLKFLILAMFLVAGGWIVLRQSSVAETLAPSLCGLKQLLTPSSGVALLFVLYAYSGWNAPTYLAGEVRNRQRTVGLSLTIGTLLVTVIYLALNALFLVSAPAHNLRGVLNVGSVAATHMLGAPGGRVMSGVIAAGLLACLSAMTWAGPRVTQRVGEDHALFGVFAVKTGAGIPMRASLLQLALVLAMILSGSFESVLVYAQVPLLLCLMLGVSGLLVLRARDPDNMPTFRCPLFPLPPTLFLMVSAAGLGYAALSRPWIAFAGLCTMLIPLALYPWIASRSRQP